MADGGVKRMPGDVDSEPGLLEHGVVPDRPPGFLGPLVSIVTPSLNQGRFIQSTIDSVRGQDYPWIEHVVVDGASSDDTLGILGRSSPPIRFVSEPDAGQTPAINRGFRMARGHILAWLNADDLLRPWAVSRVVEAFQTDPEVMMVYGRGDFVDEAGRGQRPFRFSEPFNLRRLVEVHDYILQPAAFVRREALEAVGYLDESLNWAMDWDLWIRIGRRFRVGYLPIDLAVVRLHPATKTSLAGAAKILEMHRIVRRHSRRRLPPSLLIHGTGTLYRMACRALGRSPSRRTWPVRFAYGLMERMIETGRLPWQLRPDPGVRRPTPLPAETSVRSEPATGGPASEQSSRSVAEPERSPRSR